MVEFSGGLVVKDWALLLLWLEFDPWPSNFCMPWEWGKKKKKKKTNETEINKCQIKRSED